MYYSHWTNSKYKNVAIEEEIKKKGKKQVKNFTPVHITQLLCAIPHHCTHTYMYLYATASLSWHPAGNDKGEQMLMVISSD